MAQTPNLIPSEQNFALFEGSSIKQFIIDQLNANGIFVDQNYLGSNLNCFIDIIAVMLQQMLFHYNNTASESTFSSAVLYENMNKIVNLLNYKPNGRQTAIFPAKITASIYSNNTAAGESKVGTFIIPRYSFITGNSTYILKDDIVFSSVKDSPTEIETILFEGTLHESEKFEITGEDFQVLTLIDTDIKGSTGKFITDGFFDVYVKNPETGRWTTYTETHSLFDATANDCVYEKRLNENYNYEFKFGDNINGKKPVTGSEVVIFYVVSSGAAGEMSTPQAESRNVIRYTSDLYNEIILSQETGVYLYGRDYVTPSDLSYILCSITGPSTKVASAETTEIIRKNAPKVFAAQNRLLTAADYTTYIKKYFDNFIKDCYIFNNDEYIGDFTKYFYDLGLSKPNEDFRVLLNQVTFQTSCSFNNVYVVMLPLINTIIDGKVPNYVNSNLKQYVKNKLDKQKDITHNIIPVDPIYKAVSFGILRQNTTDIIPSDFDDVKLVFVRNRYSSFNSSYIVDNAVEIIKSYFNNVMLGDTLDIAGLSSRLSQISGVKKLQMTDGTNTNDKLTFTVWNPLYYEKDIVVTQQNIAMSPFMFHYFYNLDNLKSKITVRDE